MYGSGNNMGQDQNMTSETRLGSLEGDDQPHRHVHGPLGLRPTARYRFNIMVRLRQRFSKFFLFAPRARHLPDWPVHLRQTLYVANVITCSSCSTPSWATVNMYWFEVIGGLMSDHAWPDSPRFLKITPLRFRDTPAAEHPDAHRPVRPAHQPVQRENLSSSLWFWFVFCCQLHLREFPVLDLASPVPLQPRLAHQEVHEEEARRKKLQEDEMAKSMIHRSSH
ncbi:hypothetical protein Btru_068122 [Bulinus truncatus]|nr:hypothetical protein Btru_068122 [Bulinus truncatus]